VTRRTITAPWDLRSGVLAKPEDHYSDRAMSPAFVGVKPQASK
jgi:hypothetical protein